MPTSKLHTRRGFVRLAAGLAASLSPALALAARETTPGQMVGPYYPQDDQLALRPGAWQDNDLMVVPGGVASAAGRRMELGGQVRGTNGEPLRGATVEIWQANAEGRYLSGKDGRSERPHDPEFQYFGTCTTGDDGRYAFRTIVPPSYPAGVIPGWVRPPHIHVAVRSEGLEPFITQVYWDDPNDPHRELHARLQRRDLLIKNVKPRKRDRLIRPMTGDHVGRVDFPILLDADTWLP